MNIICKYLVPNGYAAITVYPFVFYKDKKYMTEHTVQHEQIHKEQQLEMLIIPFFIWYGIEYLIRIIQYKDLIMAYKNISFERESYDKEATLGYLKERRIYSWLKYL